MTSAPSTRVSIDLPADPRRIIPRNGRTSLVIATGHQPTLWHAGILAKDLVADAIAHRLGGSALHVVVEHNPLEPLALDLPQIQSRSLQVHRLLLDPRSNAATTPPNRLPGLDAADVRHRLLQFAEKPQAPSHVREGLVQLAEAYASTGSHEHLAAQTTAVLGVLERPYVEKPMQHLSTSNLVTRRFVDRLLSDPAGCVRAYNRAARAHPQAGIRPLYAGREVVEVPLWAQDGGACLPVYADLGDSRKPLLFTQDPAIDLTGEDALALLRPRALTLSAIMRSEHCDLFIHGRGGSVYDRVTERWWDDWTGEDLAPMAVVSADVCLGFDVPTATREELQQAVWYAHHLPHNLDRVVSEHDEVLLGLVAQKRELLSHMHDDRVKPRRSAAFHRIHAINAELASRYSDVVSEANDAAENARVGFSNAAIARRRDWCFALIPGDQLNCLAQEVRSRMGSALNRC